jgi:phage baseplate assembly protein W
MNTPELAVNEALGSGLEFPIRVNQRGGLAVARGEDKVKQSIVAILSTAKGERVMRPEFGCGIHQFAFTTLDRTSHTLIQSSVREALVLWEPRITVKDVLVEPEPDRGLVRVTIDYTVRSTNAAANLVYPFYLQTAT